MVVKKERRSTGEGRGAEIEDTVAAVTRGRAGAGVKAGAEVERGAGRALFIPVVAGKTHRGSVDSTIRLKKECSALASIQLFVRAFPVLLILSYQISSSGL